MYIYYIGETFEKRLLALKEIHILCYVHYYFVQWVAFEKIGMFDLVLTYNRDWAQYGLH